MKHPVLVTCSRGTVGTSVVQRLAAAGVGVRAGVHALSREATKTPLVSEVICDFEQRASVQRALADVESVILITPVCPESAEYAARFIDEAKQTGVRHIVRLSGLIAASGSETTLGQWHASAEGHLVQSGIAHSILRPTLFMQNFATYYRPDALGYFYVASGTGRASYVDARDVAEVAAHLIEHGPVSSEPLTLTGPAALHSSDAAHALSVVAGRKIVNGRITPRQAALAMRLMGMPGWAVAAFRQIHDLMCDGFYDCVSDAVMEKTNAQRRPFERFASDYASVFAGRGAGWASSIAAQVLVRVAPK
jgi:uncharacterized protein YbjT (DUF2867 family)